MLVSTDQKVETGRCNNEELQVKQENTRNWRYTSSIYIHIYVSNVHKYIYI